MPDQFHLLIGEDGEPIAIAYGPARHKCETVLMVNNAYDHYRLGDEERSRLCQKLVEAANKSLT